RHTRSKRDWSSDVCSSDLSSGRQSGRVPMDSPTTPSISSADSNFSLRTASGACVLVNDWKYAIYFPCFHCLLCISDLIFSNWTGIGSTLSPAKSPLPATEQKVQPP